MTTIKRFGASALLLAGLVVASSAHAAIIDTKVQVNAVVGGNVVTTSTTTTTSTQINATVNANPTVVSGDVVSVTADSVSSSAGFDAYAQSVLTSDTNVTSVASTDDTVTLSYRQPAKFFGIFPITVSAKAVVKADGSTDVVYPWYARGTDSKLKADLDASAGSIARVQAGASLSASTKARIVQAMKTVMAAHYTANASAAATVK